MKQILLNSYAFNLKYANALVADVEDKWMTHSPAKGIENHPAFTLGHLASAGALTVKYLGGSYDFDQDWERIFKRNGPGDPRLPEPNSDVYPSKEDLLRELAKQHQKVEELITSLQDDRFDHPAKWRYTSHMPTLGDLLYFMCITHEAMHLGQLACWRRAMNLPSALAKL